MAKATTPFIFEVSVPDPKEVYPDYEPGDFDYKDHYDFAAGYYADRLEEILERWDDLHGWRDQYVEPVRHVLAVLQGAFLNSDCAPRAAGEAMGLYNELRPFLEELTSSYNNACKRYEEE